MIYLFDMQIDIEEIAEEAEFCRFFLGKFSELLAINHSLYERRDIFVPWLLTLSHVLVVLKLVWVRPSPQMSRIK